VLCVPEGNKDMACSPGDPDVDFADIAKSFFINAEKISSPSEIKPAMNQALKATKDGRPCLIDAIIARQGLSAGINRHPDISIASMRTRKI